MSPRRFTLDGSEALEAALEALGRRVAGEIRHLIPPHRLAAVLLGGGYGRGEGGVLRLADGDHPYNDFESFVLVHGSSVLNERRYRGPLHALGERLSPEAEMEVEFKVLSPGRLRRSPVTMFFHDLVVGHRCLHGDESVLRGCEHHRDASRIPAHEATRLLMNRCSGLLFARERLDQEAFSAADADFVGRNIAKARLALGDVALTVAGRYHGSCRERHSRLQRWAEGDDPGIPGPLRNLAVSELVPHHAAGVAFKLHPTRSPESREVLSARHSEVSGLARGLWLQVEGFRLGRPYPDVSAYVSDPAPACPETPALRNLLVNLRAFGPTAGGRPFRNPRERLLRALPALLWSGPSSPPLDAARALRCPPGSWRELVRTYAALWPRFH